MLFNTINPNTQINPINNFNNLNTSIPGSNFACIGSGTMNLPRLNSGGYTPMNFPHLNPGSSICPSIPENITISSGNVFDFYNFINKGPIGKINSAGEITGKDCYTPETILTSGGMLRDITKPYNPIIGFIKS